jgi:hypothetical protein
MTVGLPGFSGEYIFDSDILKRIFIVNSFYIELSLLCIILNLRIYTFLNKVVQGFINGTAHFYVNSGLQLVKRQNTVSKLHKEVFICLGQNLFQFFHILLG